MPNSQSAAWNTSSHAACIGDALQSAGWATFFSGRAGSFHLEAGGETHTLSMQLDTLREHDACYLAITLRIGGKPVDAIPPTRICGRQALSATAEQARGLAAAAVANAAAILKG